ncbi:MAG: hypothetical protein QM831_07670 [Kofleriaceae bacterium]
MMWIVRALVPSWRFFDRPSPPPSLWVRKPGGEWVEMTPPARTPWRFLFAPRSNLYLAYQSAVERLVGRVDELDPATDHDAPVITSLVEYVVVEKLAIELGAVEWKIVREGEDYLLGRGRSEVREVRSPNASKLQDAGDGLKLGKFGDN